MERKYKKGDKLRWLGAPEEVFAYGTVLLVYKGDDGNMWYTVKWEILGQDANVAPHDTPVADLDQSSDIRAATHAEIVLFLEGK